MVFAAQPLQVIIPISAQLFFFDNAGIFSRGHQSRWPHKHVHNGYIRVGISVAGDRFQASQYYELQLVHSG
jgi:hypothetical protein